MIQKEKNNNNNNNNTIMESVRRLFIGDLAEIVMTSDGLPAGLQGRLNGPPQRGQYCLHRNSRRVS